MADDFTDDEEQTRSGYVPALDKIVQAVPEAQGVDEAAAYLNDYVQQRNMATANSEAGAHFVNDLSDFQNGLVQFVTDDPGGVHAAMKAVEPVAHGVVSTIPGVEDPDAHAQNLIRGIQGQIATAAVTSAAERDGGMARALLDHPAVSAALPDGAEQHLSNYIETQDRARVLDGHVQQIQAAKATDQRANAAAFSYASELLDPKSELPVFPSRWNQAVTADNSVTPLDTAILQRMYGRLAIDGGAPTSDPFLLSGVVRDIADGGGPQVREMLSHVAEGNLRFSDGLHLASLASDKSDAGKAHATALSGLLDQGRSAIMDADPIAGARAFERYTNWLMPQYMRTGPAGADPNGDAYILRSGIAPFLPRAEDLVPAPASGERPTLKEIFSGR